MSDDSLQIKNCSSSTYSYVISSAISLNELPKNAEQSMVDNFFSNYNCQKEDGPLHIESTTPSFSKSVLFSQKSFIKKKEASTSPILDIELKDLNKKEEEEERQTSSLILPQPSVFLKSHEKIDDKSMESRKLLNDKCSKNINSRTASDLARKKLEAELKAAEEIAKIKETVIEKRLALELASLQDSFDRPVKKTPSPIPPPPMPPPLADLRPKEEPVKKRFSAPEDNPGREERECMEYSFVRGASRPPVLTNSAGSSSKILRQSSPIAGKLFKTDSSSSILNSIRNINILDKKFNTDKKYSGHNEFRTPSPTATPTAKEAKYKDSRYKPVDRPSGTRQGSAVYNFVTVPQSKARLIWKSAMKKIKKKMKSSKSPPEWVSSQEIDSPRRK